MEFKELQVILNESAMDDVECIRAKERLNNRFLRREDAEKFLKSQEHPEMLFIMKHENGQDIKYSVCPFIFLDADNIPVQDGDIVFESNDNYYRIRLEQKSDYSGFRASGMRDGKEICSYRINHQCRCTQIRHHKWAKKEKYELKLIATAVLTILAFIAELVFILWRCDDSTAAFCILITSLIAPFLIYFISGMVINAKAVDKAALTAAAIYLNQTEEENEKENENESDKYRMEAAV